MFPLNFSWFGGLSLPQPILWLRADNTDGKNNDGLSNNAAINTWIDSSDANNDLSDDNPARLKTGSESAQVNFKDYVEFLTDDRYFFTLSLSNTTIFVVGSRTPLASGRNVLFGGDDNLGFTTDSAGNLGHYNSSTFYDSGLDIPANEWITIMTHYPSGTAEAVFRVNHGATATTGQSIDWTDNDNFERFGDARASSLGITTNSPFGDLGEFLVFNGALTPNQQHIVFSYLALKYGVTLPSYRLAQTIWTNDATYNNNIIGLAGYQFFNGQTTDVCGLPLLGAKSLAVVRGTSFASPTTMTEGNALVFGDNNLSFPNQIFRLQGRGTIQVKIRFRKSAYADPLNIKIDNNDSFTGGSTEAAAEDTEDSDFMALTYTFDTSNPIYIQPVNP